MASVPLHAIRGQEDVVNRLFDLSEKRLARALLSHRDHDPRLQVRAHKDAVNSRGNTDGVRGPQ